MWQFLGRPLRAFFFASRDWMRMIGLLLEQPDKPQRYRLKVGT
jgi:hypothetical protein